MKNVWHSFTELDEVQEMFVSLRTLTHMEHILVRHVKDLLGANISGMFKFVYSHDTDYGIKLVCVPEHEEYVRSLLLSHTPTFVKNAVEDILSD